MVEELIFRNFYLTCLNFFLMILFHYIFLASLLAIVEYDNDQTEIFGVVNGLVPNSVYGFRVHEFGDLSDGCTSCGDNFGHKGGNF